MRPDTFGLTLCRLIPDKPSTVLCPLSPVSRSPFSVPCPLAHVSRLLPPCACAAICACSANRTRRRVFKHCVWLEICTVFLFRCLALVCHPTCATNWCAVHGVGMLPKYSLGRELIVADRMRANDWKSLNRIDVFLHVRMQRRDVMELRKAYLQGSNLVPEAKDAVLQRPRYRLDE
jgi:hypothetical protein